MAIVSLIKKEGYVDNLAYGYNAPENKGLFELKEEYKGCVISLHENNYYDDSYFYAVVW